MNTPFYNYIEQSVVMVVDDAIVSVRLLEQALQAVDGVIVESYTNPLEALQAFRTGRCDLLITDIDMPRMDGIELVAHIKNDPQLNVVPVMIISYKDREEDRRRGLEAGEIGRASCRERV